MEGVSHEACSLAGTLKLGKLIALYDENGISIDGHIEGWFTDDTAKRFEAYGWHDDMYTAVNELIAKLEKQLNKLQHKSESRRASESLKDYIPQ